MGIGFKDWLNREYFAIESNLAYTPDQKVHHLIYATAGICGVVAMQPLPFADIFALTPIQCYMGYKIARVRGIRLSENEASDALKQIAGAVGMGFLAQQGVIGLYKLGLPFLGGFMTFPLVAGMTVGIGKAMDLYFRTKADGRSVSSDDLKHAYQLGRQEGKNVQKPVVPSQLDLERSASTPPLEPQRKPTTAQAPRQVLQSSTTSVATNATTARRTPQMPDSWDAKDEAAWQQTLRGKAKTAAKNPRQPKKSDTIDKMNEEINTDCPTSHATISETLHPNTLKQSAQQIVQSKKIASIVKMDKQTEKQRPTNHEVIFQTHHPETLNRSTQPLNRKANPLPAPSDPTRITTGRHLKKLGPSQLEGVNTSEEAQERFFYYTADTHGGKVKHGKSGGYVTPGGRRIRKK